MTLRHGLWRWQREKDWRLHIISGWEEFDMYQGATRRQTKLWERTGQLDIKNVIRERLKWMGLLLFVWTAEPNNLCPGILVREGGQEDHGSRPTVRKPSETTWVAWRCHGTRPKRWRRRLATGSTKFLVNYNCQSLKKYVLLLLYLSTVSFADCRKHVNVETF